MAISFVAIVILCISSASALGFSIVLSAFVLMWCGCCRVSDDELDERDRRRLHRRRGGAAEREEVVVHSGGDDVPAPAPERKGIPLNSKPPRLSPAQELLRDKALEKYKRRTAREERRRARQAAREARLAHLREGDGDGDGLDDSDGEDGRSSVTSRTTLTSAATTVRTASTAAYGRGAYLFPPPHLCGVEMDGKGEGGDDVEGSEVRSSHSRSSRRSSGSTRSRASQGPVATIKSYMRQRQRQRLRRREEQQQIDLFNQWAEAQMASSSELSPSSAASSAVESVAALADHNAGEEKGRGRRTSNGHRGGRGGRQQRSADDRLHANGGGFDRSQPLPQQPSRYRSSSVASSAPRPPEEVLGDDLAHYSFLADANDAQHNLRREQVHLQAGYPASPQMFQLPTEFGPPIPKKNGVDGVEEANEAAAVVAPAQHTPGSTNVYGDRQQQPQQPPQPPQAPPRRHKRTWKDVEHNVALSGFFNSPTNNSFGGVHAPYDDGEASAPFRTSPAEPTHSPLQYPGNRRE
ncbi:putative transcription like protein nupm1 [Leptomonas pyrrhocoris]|uniref:Putative transcription like protein nupm1 n=1 Tax=Leptomonas pyrrhocoris TaxID=157538 RepID=A0A0M9FYZ1_LEPPY|nr:putative transcription like protein nupm1 [Leptomonas pyrrhocoris]XP_015657228.1 putative transcription like protein nupm1 [Leptomonas pyrrhocoris]XP_015657229.1 putative transcription like protein nupm1 [Leptomonas pyrrhocoris]KPA78788.1 putative transcription like protein nupm1 [Leptomonas pyrrhocoris]KPA78789.1 putative transcription like protein nupm1 [Leptomonas pyrrhocoris]KPA78790.1 putative transcription like protein nupm1 [Leptomonas pyrrhocoris]|eukprot:XP_015657227.1 putative transcription like protein nupm1 [Leptomonas pyrrhocoris]